MLSRLRLHGERSKNTLEFINALFRQYRGFLCEATFLSVSSVLSLRLKCFYHREHRGHGVEPLATSVHTKQLIIRDSRRKCGILRLRLIHRLFGVVPLVRVRFEITPPLISSVSLQRNLN